MQKIQTRSNTCKYLKVLYSYSTEEFSVNNGCLYYCNACAASMYYCLMHLFMWPYAQKHNTQQYNLCSHMQPECPHDHSVNIKDEKGTIVIPLLFVFRASRKRRNLQYSWRSSDSTQMAEGYWRVLNGDVKRKSDVHWISGYFLTSDYACNGNYQPHTNSLQTMWAGDNQIMILIVNYLVSL